MDVEKEIGGIDDRAQRTRALQLDRFAGAVERLRAPQPVEILVDVPRGDRIARVELAVRRDIVESEGQRAAARPHLGAEQPIERDRAANLVAMS